MATIPPEQGATWPDVALEVVQFAEKSPGTFVAVATLLIVLTLLAAFLVWLLLPRAAYQMERIYLAMRDRVKQEAKDLFNQGKDDAS